VSVVGESVSKNSPSLATITNHQNRRFIMRIKMNKNDLGCVDGFRIIKLEKDKTYELPNALAARLVGKGAAEVVKVK
jgi:tRNA splicing ligase